MKHCVSCGGQQPKQAAKSNMLLKIILTAIAAAALIMIAGCGPSAEYEPTQNVADALASANQEILEYLATEMIVGTWKDVDDEGTYYVTLTFERGGSGTMMFSVDYTLQTVSFEWEVKDGKLYFEFEDGDKRNYEYSGGNKLTIGDAVYTKQ